MSFIEILFYLINNVLYQRQPHYFSIFFLTFISLYQHLFGNHYQSKVCLIPTAVNRGVSLSVLNFQYTSHCSNFILQ